MQGNRCYTSLVSRLSEEEEGLVHTVYACVSDERHDVMENSRQSLHSWTSWVCEAPPIFCTRINFHFDYLAIIVLLLLQLLWLVKCHYVITVGRFYMVPSKLLHIFSQQITLLEWPSRISRVDLTINILLARICV